MVRSCRHGQHRALLHETVPKAASIGFLSSSGNLAMFTAIHTPSLFPLRSIGAQRTAQFSAAIRDYVSAQPKERRE